jgi:hypothetical protein
MANLAETLRQVGYVTPQGVTGPNAPLAQQLKNYATNVIPTARQNLAQQRADIDAALTMGQGGVQIGDREAFERQMAQVPNLMGLTAYHGTPHTIKGKFDISKVGTGEGAQAYGHGMYFAENPAVATQYKNILSKPEFTKTAEGVELRGQLPRMLDESYSELVAKNGIQQTNYGDVTDIVGQRLDRQMKDALKANDMDWYNKVADMKLDLARFKENPPPNVGNLYKVDIPDADIPNMLDWDKPMNMQSPQILKALKIPQEAVDKYNQLSNRMEELQWVRGGLDSPEWNKITEEAKQIRAKYGLHRSGEELYREMATLAKDMGNQEFSKVAAENLKRQGITGIRYLDEGSRGKARNTTSNFVVFEPSNVKILEQNSKPMTRKEIIEQELKKVVE